MAIPSDASEQRLHGSATAGSSRTPKGPSPSHTRVPSATNASASSLNPNFQAQGSTTEDKPKKKRRGGKKHKRPRRQSFAATDESSTGNDGSAVRPSLADVPERASQEARDSFYRLGRTTSNTSLESEALLDHRDHGPLQTRRQSIVQGMLPGRLGSSSSPRGSQGQRPPWYGSGPQSTSRLRRVQRASETEEEDESNDRTPLMGHSHKNKAHSAYPGTSYGGLTDSPRSERPSPFAHYNRRPSTASSSKSKSSKRMRSYQRTRSEDKMDEYDINNPPSRPGSPKFGAEMGFDDVMLAGHDMDRGRSSERGASKELLIDIDENTPIDRVAGQDQLSSSDLRRRMTMPAEDDVCFPHEDLTEIGDEDARSETYQRPRRRRRQWPDLNILDEWAAEEKEQRTLEGIRMRQVYEPVMIDGRLRPTKQPWHRETAEQTLRWTYFNEDFEDTLHSASLSELVHENSSFRKLFIPDPPVLSDSSSESEEDEDNSPIMYSGRQNREGSVRGKTAATLSPGRVSSINGSERPTSRATIERKPTPTQQSSGEATGTTTPVQESHTKPTRYGPRPIWWLDVTCPTEAEMKVLSKSFGIHPLTAEDVMMQEQREKVELFRNYYFVTYRSFEQDATSEDHMEPVSMYVVVFREGVISFHFSQTPHPANVRRRIRQLKDYLLLTTDWISYAIIDDITDSYAPLIQSIEEEVDDIDEAILKLHAVHEREEKPKEKKIMGYTYGQLDEKYSDAGDEQVAAGDMLRKVGECRKKVMGLYRLLGNKADVIKGFAKRCNEQWDIAPRSDIGLYLGDIQDHIVTMTGNLSHYENLLSRAHSNYLAQINIRMNERAEKTNDVLGKLTVLGTIVLPMNIVTGLWGMNCIVPGQDVDNLNWFWCITAGLLVFGLSCFFIAKRAFGIV